MNCGGDAAALRCATDPALARPLRAWRASALRRMKGAASRPVPPRCRPSSARRRPSDPCAAARRRPSRANRSRCLISSQLLRLPAVRSRFMRTRTHSPFRRSPASRNFRLPAFSALPRRDAGQRRPEAAVPELHGAAAVLALRNRALEIPVIERVILDFDREPSFGGIERRALGDRPGPERRRRARAAGRSAVAGRHASARRNAVRGSGACVTCGRSVRPFA